MCTFFFILEKKRYWLWLPILSYIGPTWKLHGSDLDFETRADLYFNEVALGKSYKIRISVVGAIMDWSDSEGVGRITYTYWKRGIF